MKILRNSLLPLVLACQSAPAVQEHEHQHETVSYFVTSESAAQDGAPAKGFAQINVDDGKHGELALTLQRNGSISASLNGSGVPSERIVREGDRVRVLDADGGTLYELQVSGQNGGLAYPYGAAGRQSLFGGSAWAGSNDAVKELMTYTAKPRHIIGVVTTPVDGALAAQLGLDAESAVIVNEITPGKPAEKAGVQPFDVITKIDGAGPVTRELLRERVTATEIGKTLKLSLLRRGQPLELDVEVGETTDENAAFPRVYVGDVADGAAGADSVWDLTTTYGDAVRDEAELEKAHVELERARESLEARITELNAQAAQGGAAGEAAGKAAEELKAALASMIEAQDSMRAHADRASPEVRFFNVGPQGDRGLLLRQPGAAAGGQRLRRSEQAPSAQGMGAASADADAARMAELEARIAQLDARVEQLVKALEEARKP